jgi:hypothetical protein
MFHLFVVFDTYMSVICANKVIILDDQQKYQVFVAKLSQLLLRLILQLVYIENVYDWLPTV